MIPVRRRYTQNWLPELFNDILENDWTPKASTTAPAINVSEDETGYRVEVAAPGMTKEDFKIYLADEEHLVVAIEKKEEAEEQQTETRKYLRREFSYSKFQQTMALPDDVDREQISASVKDGILTVDLKKKAPEKRIDQPKMIDIL